MRSCFPWELAKELHPLQGDRVHLTWAEMQIRAESAFLGSPGAARNQLGTGAPVLSALQDLLQTLHSHCWPVTTPDQWLLHFNICFFLHPGLVQSLARMLETALGSPGNGEVGVSHADKLRAAKHKQGLWLLMAASLRNVVWDFFSLSWAIFFTKCLTHMLTITHHGLGRDYFNIYMFWTTEHSGGLSQFDSHSKLAMNLWEKTAFDALLLDVLMTICIHFLPLDFHQQISLLFLSRW